MKPWLNQFLYQRKQAQPVMVLGASVMDVVADTDRIPEKGGDQPAFERGVHLGGCALNIALALHRLGVSCVPMLPIGEGMWAERLRAAMASKGIHSQLNVTGGDNGWCLALVEPDGERTFISFDGIENQWQAQWLAPLTPTSGFVSISGYQLSVPRGDVLLNWVNGLPTDVKVVVDFGPRLDRISPQIVQQLLRPGVILTLNEREAQILGMQKDGVEAFCQQLHQQTKELVVVRMGEAGCYYHQADDEKGWVDACLVNVVDTIGAGDSHCAGLLAGLASNLSAKDALTLANHIAAYVVSFRGGDCAPTIEELAEFF